MSLMKVSIEGRAFGQTARRDAWWLQPLLIFLGLSAFIVYSTWAAFQGEHYTSGRYLSPFYAPELFGDSPHSWFGPQPSAWPGRLPWSKARASALRADVTAQPIASAQRWSGQTGTNHGVIGCFRLNRAVRLSTIAA